MPPVEEGGKPLLGLGAIAQRKEGCAIAEGRIRCRRDQRGRLTDGRLHPLMFVYDADRARQRHDREKGEDQHGDGPPQDRLDPAGAGGAVPGIGLGGAGERLSDATEDRPHIRKFDAQPLIGCGDPPRVQHRPCLCPSCDSKRRSPESDAKESCAIRLVQSRCVKKILTPCSDSAFLLVIRQAAESHGKSVGDAGCARAPETEKGAACCGALERGSESCLNP